MPDSPKFVQFHCPACAGEMDFDPQSGMMKCLSCGNTVAVPEPSGVVTAHALEDALKHVTPLSDIALEVNCDGCGSVVVFEPPEVAGACSFCGATIVAQPKAADPMIAPDAVLPLKVTKDAAQGEVRDWIGSRWFAPNALHKMAQQEGIAGVYLPFWTYAADTESQYSGARGVHYYTTEYYTETDSNGNTVQMSRQVMQTAWSPASGRVARNFADVLVPATKSVNEGRLNALEPWDLPSLCAYEPAYLAGFKAQRYQVELPAGFEKAKAVMERVIEQDVREDIGGDEQQVNQVHTSTTNETFKHLLLPVWIGAYQFQGKVFQVMVNARTGEVQGERPYSAVKIAMLVIGILISLFVLIELGGRV
jgi:ribosomal protein S27E